MKNLHLDIETGDPDDLWTLALVATHPRLNLKTVSVHPGRPDQIGLIRKVLHLVGRKDVKIGADVLKDDKRSVGGYYYKWLGDIPEEEPDLDLLSLKKEIEYGSSLLTGGPIKNIGTLLNYEISDKKLFHDWTMQGGFVGSNIISDDIALDKFKGKHVMATYNLGGHKKSAEYLMGDGSKSFETIRMVGKNVCHGFTFTKLDLQHISKGKHTGLDLMLDGLVKYFNKNHEPKAMHDILAALLHINPEHGVWVTGRPYKEKGCWGFKRAETNIKALVSVDKEKILQELW